MSDDKKKKFMFYSGTLDNFDKYDNQSLQKSFTIIFISFERTFNEVNKMTQISSLNF